MGKTLAIEPGIKMGGRSILRVRLTLEPKLFGTGIAVLRGVLNLQRPAIVDEAAESRRLLMPRYTALEGDSVDIVFIIA